jgi:hypothetical protein
MILEATAVANGGCCGTCKRTRGWRNRLRDVRSTLMALVVLPFSLVALPFQVLHLVIRRQWRRFRFPYHRKALHVAILAVHPARKAARDHLGGVITGYWENVEEHMFGPPGEQFRRCGKRDGVVLRRGCIELTDIPRWSNC